MDEEKNHHDAVTVMLKAAADGDTQAAAELLPLVYDELRDLARSRMRKLAPGQTLQPTALVHEAFIRVTGNADPNWGGRSHFFAAAAQAMRNILVDQARKKQSVKHGGGVRRSDVDDSSLAIDSPHPDILALNEALIDLEADDPRKGQIVNLRYFAGMSNEETADALGISEGTVRREWTYTKRWLFNRLQAMDNNS